MKRGIISSSVVLFVVLIVVAIAGGYLIFFKKDLRLTPPCNPDDPDCVPPIPDDGPDCSGVTPHPKCAGMNGAFIVCGFCDVCGTLDTSRYIGTAPNPSRPCQVCDEQAEVVPADEGTSVSECAVCDGAGGVQNINEGKTVIECGECRNGKVTGVTGPYSGDVDNTVCKKCVDGSALDKVVGDSCNEKITFFGEPTLFGGQCELFQGPEGSQETIYCECNTVECQAGQKKYAVPSLDPINNQKGYLACNVIHSNDQEVATCSKWPPEPKGVTACNTCKEGFDAMVGCLAYTKEELKRRANVGYACKYKSFWAGRPKDGLCTKSGSCSGFKLWVSGFLWELNDKVNEVVKCYEQAKSRGISVLGGELTVESEYMVDPITKKPEIGKSGSQNVRTSCVWKIPF